MATNSVDTVPNASSTTPRRKSLFFESSKSSNLLENNDESERLNIRNDISACTTSRENISFKSNRKSLGISFLAKVPTPEIEKRITECVKLNAENKINVKNAFSLKMIDFMTYMVKRDDNHMCDLQVASVSLDVSTKIYSYRIDGLHTEIIKSSGGLDTKEDESTVSNVDPETELSESQKNEKKKKKRNKQKKFGTVNSLKGTVETFKPTMEIEDAQTTDALYQVILPHHANSKYCLNFCNDIILDTVEDKTVTSESKRKVGISNIKNFSELEMCPPLANFKFLDCSNIESDEDDDAQSNANNQNGFTFNLDASLPSDEPEDCNGANYVNVQDDNEDIVHVELQRPLKKIVDLREVVSSNTMSTPSEYSFIPSSCSLHWAGPSHWKIRNLTRIGGSRIEGACQQEQIKKRKELELCYDDTVIERIMPKFIISKFTTLKGAKLKWTEEALTLPRDMCYDITNANKLYLHELITIRPTEEDELNATHVSDDMLNYNYNNENDTSYCPNVPNEDYEEHEIDNNRNGVENVNAEELLPSTGDNLVAVPKLTNKIAITYNTRAKKVDMRQLKTAICKVIDDNNNQGNASTENGEDQEKNEEKGTNLHFSEVYKALPNLLTTNNAEALSFPIGFVSLLHVANEKNLKLESNPEMSDIIITKS